MKKLCTTCPYCGVGCGVVVDEGHKVSGDPVHPANFGRLCSKGLALGETLGLEGRLLTPEIGKKPASWDAALDLVAAKFQAAIAEHGPDSVAFYASGQMLTEDYYVANKFMKGFVGTANIDTNSRLCMSSSVAGHKRAFGTDTVPGCYEDLEQADVIVLVGSNLAWCHPVLAQRIVAAREARPQMRVINIDPRRTQTSDLADLHLPIRADTDSALFNGLLVEISRCGVVDANYVTAHVDGFDDALAAAKISDPHTTGLSSDQLAEFFDLWIGSEKVVTVFSQGVNQSVCGTDKVNAILNCHLATGRIGRAGMGPFSITGQPNAMGGREVGGLANTLACHLDIEDVTHRAVVQKAWDAPTMCTQPGLKAVDLFKACKAGKIKALWVMSTNPVVSMPEADFVADAIRAVDFTVVSEAMRDTDTSVLADVCLPATAWGEKTGTVTNSERRISLQRAFLPAPGDSRPDWQHICEVAMRMGWVDAFPYTGPAAIFREYAHLSGQAAALGRDFDISGLADMTDVEYADFKPVQWPVPATGTAGGRFFAQGKFFHPGGKAKMLPIRSGSVAIQPQAGQFRLNTGRIRDQWHTMTRSGKSARLSEHLAEPFVEIHPRDAAKVGVLAAGLVTVSSNSGSAILRVLISDRAQPGAVFVPMHWTSTHASAGRINATVACVTDPVSGQPAFKGSFVSITPFAARWHGFAASARQMTPTRPYAATVRTRTGWRCDLAGTDLPLDWEAEARAVLNLADGVASVVQDVARGIARVAIHDRNILRGLFFAATGPVAVSRSHAIGLIGRSVPARTALAGLAPSDQEDAGATVCACMDVGVNTLRAAIAKGAGDVTALGALTLAGTSCGSCKPELQALINAARMKVAAE